MVVVEVIWRQNDDVATELYPDLYYDVVIYSDELVRVYEIREYYTFVDESNTSGEHLIYVEKKYPLPLAIAAVERVLFDELTLNVESEEEKREILEDLAIPYKYKRVIELSEIVDEDYEGEEGAILIKVHIPTRVAIELRRDEE